jgi:hypothetical protein
MASIIVEMLEGERHDPWLCKSSLFFFLVGVLSAPAGVGEKRKKDARSLSL